MKRNMFFCLVLVACSSRAVTLEDLPFETVVETAGEAAPKLVSYGKAQALVANESAFPVATNALALAEGALQSSWAATGTVSRARMADMLLSPNGKTWLEVSDGKAYVYEVTNSTSVYVVSTSGEGYNGPPAGTVWTNPDTIGDETIWPIQVGFRILQNTEVWNVQYEPEYWFSWGNTGYSPLPKTIKGGSGVGALVLDWVPVTNAYQIAITDDLPDLSGYATAGSVAAVQAEVAGKADAETVVSGAVGTASAGNRYFWTSATNVVLSVGLTGGQVVNYAALRNTATNAITATASTSGWKWTGGSMTNSIPAGKMMTFGWAVDPSTGATNAYATAASEN